MGKKIINSEEELKKALDVESLNSISAEKAEKLVGMVPQINLDLLEKVIRILPENAEIAVKLAKAVSNLVDETYKNIVGENEAIKAYKEILETIKQNCSNKDLPFEELKKYYDEVRNIAAEISKQERIKEQVAENMTNKKIIAWVIATIVVLLISSFVIVYAISPVDAIPGIPLDDFVVVFIGVLLSIVVVVITLVIYNYKKKELKLKFKSQE